MKFQRELLSKIQNCKSQEMVDETFAGTDLNMNDKVEALLEAMGNPIVFYHHGEISLERQYMALSGSLLAGVWKKDYSSYEAMLKKAERMEKVKEMVPVC
jgi:hypothetical protein